MAPISVCSRCSGLMLFVFALATSVRLVDSNNAVFCEHTQFSLRCGEAEKLKVRSAVFGRTNYLTCWNAQIYTLSCALSATATVQRLCDGQIACSGLVSTYTFGDPCRYTHKYLTVEYDCEKMTTTTTTTTTTPATTSNKYVMTTRPPPKGSSGAWRVACDDTVMHLKCPANKMLDILSARYGKMTSKTCGHSQAYKSPCRKASDAIVRKTCQWENACTFLVNNRTFGPSPCPAGIYKYLAVNYKCVAPGQTFTVCENAMAELKCPDSKTVRVLSAWYGRDDTTTCPYGYTGDTKCRARVTELVSRWCAGKTKCLLVSHNNLVGKDPCPNTYKYLRLRYICQ
ncbi:hypothetical protein NP493_229g01013 [Ridgeia piscesae]|uniref:SUEL-type lectin domain-containing protein n=1 Tax=Ridgeia piscesae TaxID=27915 RepID=A0AAD9UDQ4_RIDPI|nr:hypothetical protein NP493_229g01013 [Ridgeia piscesae]